MRRSKLGAPSANDPTDGEHRYLVAHEIQHALASQDFGAMNIDKLSEDALSAKLALFEGDATIGGLATLAQVNNLWPLRTMARVNDVLKDRTLARIAATDARANVLRDAPADQRARLMFPYSSGLAFVLALYRTGGYPLVNTAYAKPPTTTEQVLHPQKYLDGELGADVPTPVAPNGWSAAVSGTAGELMTSVVLSSCLEPTAAALNASGWGGDAYAVFVKPEGDVALAWSTAWDDEASATRFEAALIASAACLAKTSTLGKFHMGAGFKVERKGARVALTRGFGDASDAISTSVLSVAITPRPNQPPAGRLTLVAPREKIEAEGGSLEGARYTNPKLGVVSDAPPGFTSKLSEGNDALTVSRKGGGAAGTFEVSRTLPNPRGRADIFRQIERGFRKGAKGAFALETAGEGAVTSTFGPAFERDYRIPGTYGGVRIVIVPMCRGTGAYLFTSFWVDLAGKQTMTAWLANTVPTTSGDPPVCSDLDP